MGYWAAVFLGIVTVATALPALERVKRADETVMFGNQQNLAHKSVKKSGPVPIASKLAQKKEEVIAAKAGPDPENELPQEAMTNEDEDLLERELQNLMQSKENTPSIFEDKPKKKMVKKEKPTVDLNLADSVKRAPTSPEKSQKKEKTRRDYEVDMRYLSYLINKMNPENTFEVPSGQQQSQRRRKRAVIVTDAKLQRLRRSLSTMAAESHMAASAQHRKKRDTNVDPRQLAMLEYLLSQANDGYDAPEEVEEPMYDRALGDEPALSPEDLERERLEDAELARLEEENNENAPEEIPDYALVKRVPDFEMAMGVPELSREDELVRAPEMGEEPIEEDEEVPREPVSVYNSEYGPLVYSMVEHKGERGLFVPLDQPSMARLAAAEEMDRQQEKERLNVLGALLSLNQNNKK